MNLTEMKKVFRNIILAAASLMIVSSEAQAKKLVILHSNDTHSQIDPVENTDLGGILRRKVLIDSIRNAEENVLLVDAGDAVQGTLFFTLYRGEVENRMMDSLGYELRILGNHEFDNGAEELAEKIGNTKSEWLASNYDMQGTELGKKFKPYTIREYDGKKIGFLGLNLDPKGMISEGNYNGVVYKDLYKAANSLAWYLKNIEHCDLVVALTHIGYAPSGTGTSDLELASKSEDIDIIIGGHSHTLIDPATPDEKKPWRVANAAGDTILVTQTGKSGLNLGKVEIDLDNFATTYNLIPVTSRLDDRIDADCAAVIEPYRQGVDSLMHTPVAKSAKALSNTDAALLNFVADYIRMRGEELAGDVDFAITNKGGIRRGIPKGNVSEGDIINMLPFNNRVEVLEIKGGDLEENFNVMAMTDGNGVSEGVDVTYDPEDKECTEIRINGKPLDPERTYRVATIDYLANGGDYMEPLTRGRKIASSPRKLSEDILDWLRKEYKKKIINPSGEERFRPED